LVGVRREKLSNVKRRGTFPNLALFEGALNRKRKGGLKAVHRLPNRGNGRILLVRMFEGHMALGTRAHQKGKNGEILD